ncbi:MAG: hypothetical protein DRI90_16165 [Deltaproteobacteria bacterium]|nr:MAG: hypothetical protein DRI90_16165 [Deltaproteobacteria bacterium]
MVVGCGSRSIGYLQDAEDAGTGGQSSVATTFGIVSLLHAGTGAFFDPESLPLSGGFFTEDFDPWLQPWSYVETRQTPDGASCDIHFTEGMGAVPTLPPLPDHVDAGMIAAGAGPNAAETLEIVFSDGVYSTDHRTPNGVNKPWPSWPSLESANVTLGIEGSTSVAARTEAVLLPGVPVAPMVWELYPDPNGSYPISWYSSSAQKDIVVLQFYVDWNEVSFQCTPLPAVKELLIPATWIYEWTLGTGGKLRVHSRTEVVRQIEGVQIKFRADRAATYLLGLY